MQKLIANPFKVTSELISFANRFSKSYRALNPQTYKSPDGKLVISLDYNKNFGAWQNNVWRVVDGSNNIEIALDHILDKEISADFVYYMIIWSACYIHYKTIHEIIDFKRTDQETMVYYQTTGRSVQSVLNGYVFIFKKWVSSKENNERLKWIFDIGLKSQKKEPKTDTSWLVDSANKTVTLYPMHLNSKSYKLFLDNKLRAPQIKIEDIYQKIEKRMRSIYVAKGYKIMFSFKIYNIQLI